MAALFPECFAQRIKQKRGKVQISTYRLEERKEPCVEGDKQKYVEEEKKK